MIVRPLAGLFVLSGVFAATAAPAEHGTGGTPAATDVKTAQFQSDLVRCVDPESGAVLRAPAAGTSGVTCHVIDSVWVSAALDTLGLYDQAARALAIHLATVRAERGIDTPAGSLPREIRTDGRAASFPGNADPESAAWLLAACGRHAASLPEAERAAYLEPLWPVLVRCADYLAREPHVGGALSGALAPASAPLGTLRTHYLGLESSRLMAGILGKEVPGLWSDRRDELYSRIRFRKLNHTGEGEMGGPWLDWWIALLPKLALESGVNWDVLKSDGAPALTESAILDWVVEEGVGPEAPLARRDALRCLMAERAAGG